MPAVHPRLTDAEAGAIAHRGRKLLRRGLLTHRQLVLLECLLWSCRSPATGAIVVSYTALQRLAHMARETIAGGLRVLERLGLLTRVKRRVRLLWHQGGQQVRQLTNAYVLHPPAANHCEFATATVSQRIETLHIAATSGGEVKAAQDALARRRAAVTSRLRATMPACQR
jgi:hypothetical protein